MAAVPLVLDRPGAVAAVGAELAANRLRARPGTRVLLAGALPEGFDAGLAAHTADGSLPDAGAVIDLRAGAAAPAPGAPPLDLAVLGLGAAGLPSNVPDALLRAARAVVVLATGGERADALRDLLEGPPGADGAPPRLREHPRLSVVCDRAGAARLQPSAAWDSDHALVVLGHREPGISLEHRVSAESFARLLRASAIALTHPARLAVLTGWTRTGGLSEAEQMLTRWTDTETPAILEVAGRNTAENASRSLPLLLATGAVRRVTVVTSIWHVRARWFFAPYRRYGLRVNHRPVVTPMGRWGPMIAGELRQLRAAPGERRDAFTAMRLPAPPDAT